MGTQYSNFNRKNSILGEVGTALCLSLANIKKIFLVTVLILTLFDVQSFLTFHVSDLSPGLCQSLYKMF